MKETIMEFRSEFWAFVTACDPKGFHTGEVWTKTSLVEFGSAQEMYDYLSDEAVAAGESMGDYIFIEHAASHNPCALASIVEEEQCQN